MPAQLATVKQRPSNPVGTQTNPCGQSAGFATSQGWALFCSWSVGRMVQTCCAAVSGQKAGCVVQVSHWGESVHGRAQVPLGRQMSSALGQPQVTACPQLLNR